MKLQRLGMLAVVALVGACSRSESDSTTSSQDCSVYCEISERTDFSGSGVEKGNYGIPGGAVVGFQHKGESCGGVHIGNRLVYTAYHCLSSLEASDCGDLGVAWEGGSGSCRSYQAYAKLDFAIVKLNGTPSASVDYLGSPKSGASIICATWNGASGEMLQMAGKIGSVNDSEFTHSCGLTEGQSGTAIFMVPRVAQGVNPRQEAISLASGAVLVGVHKSTRGGVNYAARIPGQ